MTEKEILKKDIEIELELFKIYSLFLVGLITGVAGLLLKNDNGNPFTKGLLFIGIFFLLSMGVISFVHSSKSENYVNNLKYNIMVYLVVFGVIVLTIFGIIMISEIRDYFAEKHHILEK
jgi:hypothetical protein